MNWMIPCAVLLFCADLFLAAALTFHVDFSDKLRNRTGRPGYGTGTGRLAGAGDAGKGKNTVVGLLERFELLCIEKSNIRHYIPFMNIYLLLASMVLIFILAFRPVMGLLNFFPTAFVISGMISAIPIFALDLLARYNSEMVRKKLSEYISVLNRWCSVKEDIMYAFEKSLGSGIGEPLQTFVRNMVTQVNRGLDPEEALDLLQRKVDNPQFRDFILNIKLSMRHRGDIVKLLSNLENQFYRIDEEYSRRRISTYRDRALIYFIMAAVPAAVGFFIRFSPQVGGFYLRTVEGKLLLLAFSGMYIFGFYLTTGIMKFKN